MTRILVKCLLCVGCFVPTLTTLATTTEDDVAIFEPFINRSYLPYVQLNNFYHSNRKINRWLGSVDLFIPFCETKTGDQLLFGQLTTVDRIGKSLEGNFHLGYRYMNTKHSYLLGIYGAFDRKKSKFGKCFSQVTFGIEAWLRRFFIGANYYQVVGKHQQLLNRSEFAHLTANNNIAITCKTLYEHLGPGADAEVGYEFNHGLTAFIGGYYHNIKHDKNIIGQKAHLNYEWAPEQHSCFLERLNGEVGVKHDATMGSSIYVGISLRFGLTKKRNSNIGLAKHMTDQIHRDYEMVTSTNEVTQSKILANVVAISNYRSFQKAIDNKEVSSIIITNALTTPNISDVKETADNTAVILDNGKDAPNDTIKEFILKSPKVVSPFTGDALNITGINDTQTEIEIEQNKQFVIENLPDHIIAENETGDSMLAIPQNLTDTYFSNFKI